MPKNSHLNLARKLKRDEFYTYRSTVEDELRHYTDHFKGKTVLCNCDDDEYSEFFKYFYQRFDFLGLKKLIGVHYEGEKDEDGKYKPSYKIELYKDTNKDGVVNFKDEKIKTPIYGDDEYPAGDFRSPECIELLKEADIVVTNPPFSLWRKFLAQLMEYDKKFLIIGNTGCVSYKEVFPLLKDNKMWLGYQGGGGETLRYCPEKEQKKLEEGDDGYEELLHSFGNICFFTNLTIAKRNKPLKVEGTYYTPEKYPKYDNYDAINVDKVADIPCDYPGVMGVPLTFMDKYCPEQFEIVGITGRGNNVAFKTKIYTKEDAENYGDHNAHPVLLKDGKLKSLYTRIFIRNRHPEHRKQLILMDKQVVLQKVFIAEFVSSVAKKAA